MTSRKQTLAGLTLAFLVATTGAAGAAGFPILGVGKKKPKDTGTVKKLTPEQSALIDRSIVREREIIKVVKQRAPLVETYIQNMRPDPVMRQVPESDEHFLVRVEFSKVIGDETFKEGPKPGQKPGHFGFFKNSLGALGGLGGSLHLQFHEAGFVQMLLMDSNNFDKQHYTFNFVRSDFLGNIRTDVFDVTPITGKSDKGRFFGRIWVERRDGNVVRFDGDFAGSEKEYGEFFHFDSWRTNVQEGLWLPTSIYVEESDPKSQTNTLKFKAINHVWGYALKVPTSGASNTSMEVEGATDVSNDAQDLSPLAAQRQFAKQAEDNIIERLFQAGLLDAPSDFDKILEALANNILAFNNIAIGPLKVRTLLTEPLESLSVGNTILLSKGLIDTAAVPTQDGFQLQGNLYAILAFQVAHIVSGHKLDTKYAFQDRLIFPDNSAFKSIPMHHTDFDNAEAAKKMIELLNVSSPDADKDPAFKDAQRYFGLYLQQLQQRVKGLKALNEPMIGDGLVKGPNDTSFWMQALVPKGDKLDVKNLKQRAAEPLSTLLRFDPWTDQVIRLNAGIEPLQNPSDRMPFEAAPVYIKLGYWKPPVVDPAVAAPAAAAPVAPDTTTPVPNATPAPAPGTPAPAGAPTTPPAN